MGPFTTLTVYSVFMIIGPLAAYFITKDGIVHIFTSITPTTANISAAVVAVITVHVVLFAFVYKAFQQDKPDPPGSDAAVGGQKDTSGKPSGARMPLLQGTFGAAASRNLDD